MAKKRIRNLPSKKTLKTAEALFGSPGGNKFKVGPYEVGESLDYFTDLPQISEAMYTHSAAAIVTIYLLCQLRTLRPSAKPAQLDMLPSFKFYKRTLLAGPPGRILAFAISVSQPEVVLHLPEEDDMASWLRSVLDLFVGNERKLQSVNEGNVIEFINGEMSRVIGIINSTPSNNRQSLGITEDCFSFTISDCLSRVDYTKIAEVDPAAVISIIRNSFEMSKDEEGNIIPLTFNEEPFTGKDSINGGCRLEKEIFSDAMPTRSKAISVRSSATKEAPTYHSDEELASALSPAQIKKYKAAVFLKRFDIVARLNELVGDNLVSAKKKKTSKS